MNDADHVRPADLPPLLELAQRVAAVRPDLLNSGASYGELSWNWGRGFTRLQAGWRLRTWHADGELAAWGWAQLPHRLERSDGSVKDVTAAYLDYQVHPGRPGLLEDVIGWYEATAAGCDRTLMPSACDTAALDRWAAYGYGTDPAALGDTGSWTQLNTRDLAGIEAPVLPAGYRFLTAAQAGPAAAVRAHTDAWAPTAFTAESYAGLLATPAYRADLHVLAAAPDGAMAASAIMWFDAANRTVEFEPVGTHPGHRRRGLARAVLLHGMRLARDAGATQATVACLGAPGHRAARELYYGAGFRFFSRDAPLLKRA
ncbi:GNAT family N-acetyltransferase [Actinacidiphila sp. bgisy144]|uniref:GNAT family N-acetyltransferase n=1 Tax=Actinacidiphila sp. bgisy144 TaxID=3413791 RepID=UPI003EB9160A